MYSVMYTSNWAMTAISDVITRPGVLLFVMVSGALTLGKEIKVAEFYKKALTRLLIPLFVWSLVYYIYSNGFEMTKMSLQEFFVNLLAGKDYFHLWYLHMIVGVYLSAPFLNKIYMHTDRFEKLWFLGIGILLAYVLHFLNAWEGINVNSGNQIFSLYCVAFFLGRFLFDQALSKRAVQICVITSIIVVLISSVATVDLKLDTGRYNILFSSNASPFNLLLASCYFCLLSRVNFDDIRWERMLALVSSLTLGIYALHILVRDVFITPRFFPGLNNLLNMIQVPGIGALLNAVIVLILTTLIVVGLSKIPYVQKIV